MPASFLFPDRGVDLWMPVPMGDKLAQARVAFWYTGVGRLKQNVTVEQARANMAMVQMQLATEYPKTDAAINVDIAPLKDNTVGDIRASLWLLFAAVSVLLLVACTNIAALLLSRATDRKREMSVRRSLGATRWAIIRQALTETGVLALIGGAVGLLLAAGAVAALRSAAVDMPRMDEIALDGRIVLYTLVVVLTVTLLSGVLPAIRIARDDATGPASEAGRSLVTGRNSLQWLLVGAQITLSVTLLAAAGLFVRSFQELWRVDPGFDMTRVLTFRMSGSYAETNDYDRLIQRIDSTIDELRALPGIEAAATAVFLPGIPAEREANFELVEAPRPSEGVVAAESRFVSREYFTTMQIPVIAGDLCSRRLRNGPREVMVNRSFVTRYLSAWPSPLGLHLKAGDTSAAPSRIIGIVGDARERGLDRDPGPTVYACFSAPNPIPHFLVRTHGEPLPAAETVRLKMKDLEPLRSVYNIAPLEHSISGVFSENRLRTMLLVLFAMTALSLSCVGLYSTLSYVVSLRRREVGLRLALGARPGDIVRQFVAKGVRVAAAALTIGLSFLVAVLQTAWRRTGDERWLRLTRFYGKLFLINFAMGVVTGIVQEFQFGMNWSEYSRFVGDVFGAPLAMEALVAFFLESTFLGLWIFGWDRLPARVHLAAIWAAAIGSIVSAYFILAANSWMQHPVGYRLDPDTGRARAHRLRRRPDQQDRPGHLPPHHRRLLPHRRRPPGRRRPVAPAPRPHRSRRPRLPHRADSRRLGHAGGRRCLGRHRRHPGQDHDRAAADEDGRRRGALRDRDARRVLRLRLRQARRQPGGLLAEGPRHAVLAGHRRPRRAGRGDRRPPGPLRRPVRPRRLRPDPPRHLLELPADDRLRSAGRAGRGLGAVGAPRRTYADLAMAGPCRPDPAAAAAGRQRLRLDLHRDGPPAVARLHRAAHPRRRVPQRIHRRGADLVRRVHPALRNPGRRRGRAAHPVRPRRPARPHPTSATDRRRRPAARLRLRAALPLVFAYWRVSRGAADRLVPADRRAVDRLLRARRLRLRRRHAAARPRSRRPRAPGAVNTIGPVWDGNEVWLITAVGAHVRRLPRAGTPPCSPPSTCRCCWSWSR